MLRSDFKEGVILLVFALLLHEVLTLSTLLFATGAALASFLSWKFPKWLRNSVAILVLITYWFTYGKVIDPEVGLNFLTSVMALKLLEKDSLRDRYMVFFGLVLLISSGSLFERSLTYVFFFAISFVFLLRDFYRTVGYRTRLKDLALTLLWVLPLTAIVFFLVPRMLGLPFQQHFKRPGEMGYTPEVNISSVESLESNDTPAFQALVDKDIPQELLYWRGNVLDRNDGWNWLPSDGSPVKRAPLNSDSLTLIKQQIRLLGREDYVFALDAPESFRWNDEDQLMLSSRTLKQANWKWVNRYEAISHIGGGMEAQEDHKKHLQVILPKDQRAWIQREFPGTNLSELKLQLQQHYREKAFTYSLNPGRIESFTQFMRESRIGFCSHFASATAIILRVKGVPTRLVSGYMGGNFNRFGGHYLITQNDAHVWLEALEDGMWKRLDPTEWIAPERVQLGGEAFMENVGMQGTLFRMGNRWNLQFLRDLRQWFQQWDFRFYSWLEEMDYFAQQAWLTRFQIKRQWLYVFGPGVLIVFTLIYAYGLSLRQRHRGMSEYEILWHEFIRKLRKRGLELPLNSVQDADSFLQGIEHPDRERILNVWKPLLRYSFAEGNLEELRSGIKSL